LNEKTADTIFGKIIRKEIKADIVYEDDKCLAFKDLHPKAPTHLLLIPKEKLSRMSCSEERHKELFGHLFYTASQVAKKAGLSDGYRLVVNDGKKGGQSIYHLHIHILGGKQLKNMC